MIYFSQYRYMIDLTEKEEYVLKKMVPFHCMRGSEVCDDCLNIELVGEKYCLLRIPDRPGLFTRPVTEIIIDDKEYFVEFDLEEVFDSKEKLIDAARELNVIYIDLD